MKKKLQLILSLAAVSFMASSCASYQKTGPLMGVRGTNINTYVAADFDYENAKRVEGVVKTKTLFGFIPLKKNADKTFVSSNRYAGLGVFESRALYQAKESSGVDIIVEPQFEKEKHRYFFGFYTTGKVVVKGWGLNIKGLKEDPYAGVPHCNTKN